MVSLLYKNLSTSRGAGNANLPLRQSSSSSRYSYLSTSRGAGNVNDSDICHFSLCIDTYLPREGPETQLESVLESEFLCIDTYLTREGPETFPPSREFR